MNMHTRSYRALSLLLFLLSSSARLFAGDPETTYPYEFALERGGVRPPVPWSAYLVLQMAEHTPCDQTPACMAPISLGQIHNPVKALPAGYTPPESPYGFNLYRCYGYGMQWSEDTCFWGPTYDGPIFDPTRFLPPLAVPCDVVGITYRSLDNVEPWQDEMFGDILPEHVYALTDSQLRSKAAYAVVGPTSWTHPFPFPRQAGDPVTVGVVIGPQETILDPGTANPIVLEISDPITGYRREFAGQTLHVEAVWDGILYDYAGKEHYCDGCRYNVVVRVVAKDRVFNCDGEVIADLSPTEMQFAYPDNNRIYPESCGFGTGHPEPTCGDLGFQEPVQILRQTGGGTINVTGITNCAGPFTPGMELVFSYTGGDDEDVVVGPDCG